MDECLKKVRDTIGKRVMADNISDMAELTTFSHSYDGSKAGYVRMNRLGLPNNELLCIDSSQKYGI